jgi:teichuronic acid biosynthesis protein TuaE
VSSEHAIAGDRYHRRRLVDTALLLGAAAVTAFFARGFIHRPKLAVAALAALLFLVVAALSLRRLRRVRLGRLVVGLMLLLPLLALLGPSVALPALPQLFAFRLVGVVALYLGLTWLAVTRVRFDSAVARPALLVLLWFGWLTVALIWAPDKVAGFRYLGVMFTMITLMTATALGGTSGRRLKWLLALLAAAYFLIVMMSMVESYTGYRLPTSRLLTTTSSATNYAVTSVFHNQNDLATYLSLCWPFFICAFFFTRRFAWRALALIAMALGVAAFVHTGSRSSLIAVGIESLACLAFFRRGFSRRTQTIGAIVAVLLILGAGWLAFNNSSSQMLRQFRLQGLQNNVQTNSGSGEIRVGLTQTGFGALGRFYLMGAGPGQAEVLVAESVAHAGIVNLHDWWLEVVVDGGLPAFVLHALLYFGLLAAMWRIARRGADHLLRYLAAAVMLALTGYVIGALGPSSAISFAPMWILWGLAIAVMIRQRAVARETATYGVDGSNSADDAG